MRDPGRDEGEPSGLDGPATDPCAALEHVDMVGRVVVRVARFLRTRFEPDDADDHPSEAPEHLVLHAGQPAKRLPGLVFDGSPVEDPHRLNGCRNSGLAHVATLLVWTAHHPRMSILP